MNTTRVLALLPLFVMLAHSFSWDMVVGGEKQLEFYSYGTLTHTEVIPSAHGISSVTNDPVHYRVLFVDQHNTNMSIFSFDLTTRKMQTLVKKLTSTYDYSKNLAYDPVTQLIFWVEYKEIYSLSLKPASSNEAVAGNLLVTLDNYCADIAVDSCGGYIYWATRQEIERATFDGSKREVLIVSEAYALRSLAIDQETQTMYWIEETSYNTHSIESADLNGKNRNTFYFIGTEVVASSLAVSKDFIYWKSYNLRAFLQQPKHQKHSVVPTVYSFSSRDCWGCQEIATNSTIEEQTLGIKSCQTLNSLILDVEGRNSSICHNYCFQGNCSVSAEGQPRCRCNAGYSGDRCEVNLCRGYCLNNGVCSLHEKNEPVCRCSADFGGDRCELPAVLIKCIQTVSMLREMLSAVVTPVTLGKGVKSTCAATVV